MQYSNELAAEVGSELEDRVPRPTGYHILIATAKMEKVTKGGVHVPDDLLARENFAAIVGCVLAVGPDAYRGVDAKGEPKFPGGPWCKTGDWVMFRSYSGTRFKVDDQELRLVNDDTIEAVITDPRGFTRV